MPRNVFEVKQESGYGSYRYSEATLTTTDGEIVVEVKPLTYLKPSQITLIKVCENLDYYITRFNFTNLSITLSGEYVYNNLEMRAVPQVNADYQPQSWVIKWNTQDGKEKKLMFKRRFISNRSQATTALLQANAAQSQQGDNLWGGNKRMKKTKRKKIKRKKTKKQTSR
jgi:hypothetical protein